MVRARRAGPSICGLETKPLSRFTASSRRPTQREAAPKSDPLHARSPTSVHGSLGKRNRVSIEVSASATASEVEAHSVDRAAVKAWSIAAISASVSSSKSLRFVLLNR